MLWTEVHRFTFFCKKLYDKQLQNVESAEINLEDIVSVSLTHISIKYLGSNILPYGLYWVMDKLN